MHTGILGSGTPGQCASSTVGGWRRAKPIQVRTTGITITSHPRQHPNPTYTPDHHHQPPQAERADMRENGAEKKEKGGQGTPVPP